MNKLKIFLVLLTGTMFFACQTETKGQQPQQVDAVTFKKSIETDSNALILDVRTAEEWAGGIISGATLLDFYDPEFQSKVLKLSKSKTIYLYCLSGGRSAQAANYLRSNQYKVVELKGGINAWNNQSFATIKPEGISSNKKSEEKTIGLEAFKKLINSDTITLVDFYAPWCGPCKQMAPYVEELINDPNKNFNIIKINTDLEKEISREYKITELPTIMVIKNGKIIKTHYGFANKEMLLELVKP